MATSNSTIQFHKHCQQTVCSAAGFSANGATWGTITGLEGSLTNLPNDWLEDFRTNTNNMTEDLADILKLINRVSGTLKESISEARSEFTETVSGIDKTRVIKFKMGDDDVISFNPLHPTDQDVFEIPMNDLTIKYYATPVGSVKVAMPTAKEIVIPPVSTNINTISMTRATDGAPNEVLFNVQPESRVFKTIVNASTFNYDTIIPKISIGDYYWKVMRDCDNREGGAVTSGKPVIEWEWQVQCTRGDGVVVNFDDMEILNIPDAYSGYVVKTIGYGIPYGRRFYREYPKVGMKTADIVDAECTHIYKFRLDLSGSDTFYLEFSCDKMYRDRIYQPAEGDVEGDNRLSEILKGRACVDQDQNAMSGTPSIEVQKGGDKTEEIRLNGGTRVYRREWKEGEYLPRIYLTHEFWKDTDVLEFELHLTNTNADGLAVWLGYPGVTSWNGNSAVNEIGEWRIFPMNHRNVVTSGHTNVYLFRMDMYARVLTWEFKYAYDNVRQTHMKTGAHANYANTNPRTCGDKYEENPMFTYMCVNNRWEHPADSEGNTYTEENMYNPIILLDPRYKAYFKNINPDYVGTTSQYNIDLKDVGNNTVRWQPRVLITEVDRKFGPWGEWGFLEFELHIRNGSQTKKLTLGGSVFGAYPDEPWAGRQGQNKGTHIYYFNGAPANIWVSETSVSNWAKWGGSGEASVYASEIGTKDFVPPCVTCVYKYRLYTHNNVMLRKFDHMYYSFYDSGNTQDNSTGTVAQTPWNYLTNPERVMTPPFKEGMTWVNAECPVVVLTQGKRY